MINRSIDVSAQCTNETQLLNETDASTNALLAHDIRVEPYTRTVVYDQNQQSYQLSVDISWQMPLNGIDTDIDMHFVPRFHFTTESIFDFGEVYVVKLLSLLKSNFTKMISKEVMMPQHPDADAGNLSSMDCKGYANPHASRWTAGFRRIVVHPVARTIQVEFVGAPLQYCFEGYEVRLKDETGMELLHSHVIYINQMRAEIIENHTVLFGEHNFTDLVVEREYIPSVIPLERARDGRCLCPVFGTSPFESDVICSCIAADWNKIRIEKIEKSVITPQHSIVKQKVIYESANGWKVSYIWLTLIPLMLIGVTILLLIFYIAYLCYLRHQNNEKMSQIRFAAQPSSSSSKISHLLYSVPLIHSAQKNILIVYSHDHAIHEKCVLRFAEYLRDVFDFDVHLDVWDIDQIERNSVQYISNAVLRADKVMIINSIGAYHHYRCKIEREYYIERINAEPLDDLFSREIDFAVLHSSLISVHFKHTSGNLVLPPLVCQMQYNVPNNLAKLLSKLTETSISNKHASLNSYSCGLVRLNMAIAEMVEFQKLNTNWFYDTHRRVPRTVPLRDHCQQIACFDRLKSVKNIECRQLERPKSLIANVEQNSRNDEKDQPVVPMQTMECNDRSGSSGFLSITGSSVGSKCISKPDVLFCLNSADETVLGNANLCTDSYEQHDSGFVSEKFECT